MRAPMRWAAIVLGLALLGAAFAACFERREVELPGALSREARENPYLALERLLTRMGATVHRVAGPGELDPLPAPGASLLLLAPRTSLSAPRARRILEWVEAGGHLITSGVPSLGDEPAYDPLLSPMGLQLYAPGELEEADAESSDLGGATSGSNSASGIEADLASEGESDDDEDEALGESAWDLVRVAPPGVDEALEVELLAGRVWDDALADGTVWEATGFHGVHVLVFGFGRGQVTALSDAGFASNLRIGDVDHAEFLVRVSQPLDRNAGIWIVTGEQWHGLLTRLLRHARPGVVSAAVLAAAALLVAMRRFGPPLPEPSFVRRRWIEHLEAVGRFHWRNDRARGLATAARTSALRELARRRPAWTALPDEPRMVAIAENAGLSEARVARARRTRRDAQTCRAQLSRSRGIPNRAAVIKRSSRPGATRSTGSRVAASTSAT